MQTGGVDLLRSLGSIKIKSLSIYIFTRVLIHPGLTHDIVEVEENENVVEKFKEGMMSVHNILALDRLKQKVCLKEKLAKNGQLSCHHTTTVDVSMCLNR